MFFFGSTTSEVIVTLVLAEVNGNVYRCSFNLLTSDGFLHNIEISQDPAASISSLRTSSNGLTLNGQFPQHVFCSDYHTKLSLLAVVGSSSSISTTSSGTTGIFLYFLFHYIFHNLEVKI